MKRPTKKQREFQAKLNNIFTRKKNYKHQRKHNGIPNLGSLHPNFKSQGDSEDA